MLVVIETALIVAKVVIEIIVRLFGNLRKVLRYDTTTIDRWIIESH